VITIAKRKKRSAKKSVKKSTRKRSAKRKSVKRTSSKGRAAVGKTRLNPMHFGLAWGITFGVSMWLLGMLSAYYYWGVTLVNVLGSFYTYFGPSVSGSFYGLVWGFIDGFIGGYVIAWLYNWMEHVK